MKKITRRDFLKVAGVLVQLLLWQAAPAWLPVLRLLLLLQLPPRPLLLRQAVLLPQLATWS